MAARLVRKQIAYPAPMRMYISCGDPIPADKRKDARYCGQSKCRGREYRKRHPKPAAAAPSVPQTATVLACPCGRRYLLTVAELHDHAVAAPPQPAQVALTQTAPQTEQSEPSPRSLGTEACTQTARQTDPASLNPVPPASPPAGRELRASMQTVSVMDAHPDKREVLSDVQAPAGHHGHAQQVDAPGLATPP